MVSRRSFVATVAGGVATLGTGMAVVGGVDGGGDGPVTALVAGSLFSLGDAVPGAAVEAHGSVAVRRLVLDGVRDPDAVALADPQLLDGLAASGRLFASNALVLAYNPDSPHADAVAGNWRAAIQRQAVGLGRTDPRTDPLGYRTVLGLRLAADLDPGSVLADSSIHPETEVMAVLEHGDLDCAFVYRNMAIQHGLPFVELPGAIDFSAPALADHYGSVSVEIDGDRIRGAPIRYVAAARTERGRAWVDRLVTGRERLREGGFLVPEGYPAAYEP